MYIFAQKIRADSKKKISSFIEHSYNKHLKHYIHLSGIVSAYRHGRSKTGIPLFHQFSREPVKGKNGLRGRITTKPPRRKKMTISSIGSTSRLDYIDMQGGSRSSGVGFPDVSASDAGSDSTGIFTNTGTGGGSSYASFSEDSMEILGSLNDASAMMIAFQVQKQDSASILGAEDSESSTESDSDSTSYLSSILGSSESEDDGTSISFAISGAEESGTESEEDSAFAELDTDGDGVISSEELKAAIESATSGNAEEMAGPPPGGPPPGGPPPGPPPESNGEELSEEEIATMEAEMQKVA